MKTKKEKINEIEKIERELERIAELLKVLISELEETRKYSEEIYNEIITHFYS